MPTPGSWFCTAILRLWSLEFNCVPGNYELYVIANAYADLGELQYAQVTDRTVNFMVGLRSLPMSAMQGFKSSSSRAIG